MNNSASSSDCAESPLEQSETSENESQPPASRLNHLPVDPALSLPSAPSVPSIASMPCLPSSSNAIPADGKSTELDVRHIYKSFGSVHVLRDVSFTARSGEFVTLLGPSGCGKTTLLRILAGLELADSGSVTLMGEPMLAKAAHRRPVNTVFQNYALFPHLNVFENIAFGLRARKFPNVEVRKRVGDTLDMLQLEEFIKRYPHELSGGQKQRVALARALVNEPELLLLDEPMSALDAKLRAEVQIEIRRLQRRLGKTFILVTHDQDEAMTVSDRIMVMCNGQIAQSGTPTEVYEHPVNQFVSQFLGSANLISGVRIPSGVRTALGDLRVRRPPTWEKGTLAIRPERIRLKTQTPQSNGIRGEIKELIYRGDHYDLFIEPGAVRVRVVPSEELHVGQRVWLELPPEHLEVLAD